MSETKEKMEPVIEYLVKKGYAHETAVEIVKDVTDGMRVYRLAKYDEYKNKKVRIDFDGLKVDCIVHDVKYTEKDGLSFQVEPIAGRGHKWVSELVEVIK